MSNGTAPSATPPLPANAPPGFHLLAKPGGSTCNIDCTYCFFLSKESLYPNDRHRMSQDTLEACIRQLLESHRTPQVTVAWQGGGPTLMKRGFFRRAVELVEQYRQGRALPALPLRQRREVPLLPRRQGARLAVQQDRQRYGGAPR